MLTNESHNEILWKIIKNILLTVVLWSMKSFTKNINGLVLFFSHKRKFPIFFIVFYYLLIAFRIALYVDILWEKMQNYKHKNKFVYNNTEKLKYLQNKVYLLEYSIFLVNKYSLVGILVIHLHFYSLSF